MKLTPGYIDGVPSDAWSSATYQRFLTTGETEVTDDVRRRYDALVGKRLVSTLEPAEESELARLETEMDGSDYAAHPRDYSWFEARKVERDKVDRELCEIVKRIGLSRRAAEEVEAGNAASDV